MILDTPSLLAYAYEPGNLSDLTVRKLDKAKVVHASSISLLEIAAKQKRKQLKLPVSLDEFVETLAETNIQLLSIDPQLWLDSINLKWNNPNPADRIIVATAKRLRCSIVTHNKKIKRFYSRTIS